jgi:hypothetical protein
MRTHLNHPIKHHYLPVFYLKQWCGGDGKVVRYYRPHKEVVAGPLIPDSTGFEQYLYTLDGFPIELRASIETHYMAPEIDDQATGALALLLAGGLTTMNDANKRAWARFLASLALRNPQTLAAINAEMRQQLIAQFCAKPEVQETYRTSGDTRGVWEWIQNHYPLVLERAGTLELPRFIKELSKPFHAMRWSVCDLSTSSAPLLTSDRPLFEQHGFGHPRHIVALPLSPHFLFVAASASESIQTLATHPPDTVVAMINHQLTTQAAAHVYGNTKSHVAFIERHLRPKC